MYRYFKNLILSGEIDYHCLLCKESFTHVNEVEKHIRWEMHRKAIKSLTYLPKFRKDCIYKIGDYYLCEICNFATPATALIENHIKEKLHKSIKANPQNVTKNAIAHRDSDTIVISKMVLDQQEWHGIIDSQCVLCNTAVNSFHKHIALTSHIINLIQAETKFENGQYYRKINDETFYCFKCQKTYSLPSLSNHFTDIDHNKKIQPEAAAKKKPKQYFDVNKENNTATCRVCKKTMDIKITLLYDHRSIHNKGEKDSSDDEMEEAFRMLMFYDHGKRRSELKKYGKENHIKLNSGGSKGFCSLCNTFISAHMNNFKQHVSGANHSQFMQLFEVLNTLKPLMKKNGASTALLH